MLSQSVVRGGPSLGRGLVVVSRLSVMSDLDSALDKVLDEYENKPPPKQQPSQSEEDSDVMQSKTDNDTANQRHFGTSERPRTRMPRIMNGVIRPSPFSSDGDGAPASTSSSSSEVELFGFKIPLAATVGLFALIGLLSGIKGVAVALVAFALHRFYVRSGNPNSSHGRVPPQSSSMRRGRGGSNGKEISEEPALRIPFISNPPPPARGG